MSDYLSKAERDRLRPLATREILARASEIYGPGHVLQMQQMHDVLDAYEALDQMARKLRDSGQCEDRKYGECGKCDWCIAISEYDEMTNKVNLTDQEKLFVSRSNDWNETLDSADLGPDTE